MVVIIDTGDGGWDTQEEPMDMLVGRVFGGLPNGRLGRHSVKAARSPVDPGTEPSTPCSSFPDLGNANTWETPTVSQGEAAGMNSTADKGQSDGVDGLSHGESLPPSPSPAAPTGLEGLGDPVVQERLMRETILLSLLEPPETGATRANREAEGSGMIGGEVYAGSPEAAAASMAVGYSCTYIASETVTIESSVSHARISSPAAARAAAGAGGAATGDGLGGAASPPDVDGGGGDASGGVGDYGYGGGGGGGGRQPADSLTMFDAAIQPPPSRDTGVFDGIVSDSFHRLFDRQDSIFRSWPSPPLAPSSPPRPPPPSSSRSPPSPPSPPSEPLPRSAPSPDSHTWQQQQQQWPGHGAAGLPSAFSPDRIGLGWSTSRGQEAASPPPPNPPSAPSPLSSPSPPSEQVNLADSVAWLFVVGPLLGEGALTGAAAAAAVDAAAAATAVLDAPAPVPVAVNITAGARGGGGGDGCGGGDDAADPSLTNAFATWFRSARSPSPATGGICRAVRAVSATLSSLVCACFERMHDDGDDSQSERE